jgi:hypothetical protein
MFYTNDLTDTPTSPIAGPNEQIICCICGLSSLKRWVGGETSHQTELEVPVLNVAYNCFMNSVDRFDQMQSANISICQEKQVSMSIFTFLLDAIVHNTFALLKEIDQERASDMK